MRTEWNTIRSWVIVLSFTLGGLFGDNPLLGETRPNTTSLISLLRPCALAAIESHAQLSAVAPSPRRHQAPTAISTVPRLTSQKAILCYRYLLLSNVPSYVPGMSRARTQSQMSVRQRLIASQQVHIAREPKTMQPNLNTPTFIVTFFSRHKIETIQIH